MWRPRFPLQRRRLLAKTSSPASDARMRMCPLSTCSDADCCGDPPPPAQCVVTTNAVSGMQVYTCVISSCPSSGTGASCQSGSGSFVCGCRSAGGASGTAGTAVTLSGLKLNNDDSVALNGQVNVFSGAASTGSVWLLRRHFGERY